MMKLISFKGLKLAVIVICMLAAGICYSCSMKNNITGQADTVMALNESADHESAVHESADRTREAPDSGGSPEYGTDGSTKSYSEDSPDDLTGTDAQPGQADRPLIYVHVCGLVSWPGVYELPEGSRVYEAIEAAGGFAEDAASDYLNLAGVLEDGMKLQVPDRNQAEAWMDQYPEGLSGTVGRAATQDGTQKGRVNLNTATREELMTLRGIGESRAEDIIHYRDTFGGFKTIEDIMNVSGIKEAAFEKIKDSITV